MDHAKALHALKKYFGYDRFRPLQSEIISAIFAGRDAVVLMPTGGGKSICYQIPAITLPGTAVVLSPLISLMKDQVEGLRANGVRAAYLNSSLSAAEQRKVEDDFCNGELNLLYISPEKLISGGFMPVLRRRKINLFAVDEAHCISAWGHDFRPEYTQLRALKENFPDVPILALTATADRLTRLDIVEQLGLPDPARFIASFDRPNLSLEVRPGRGRFEQIVQFIKQRPNQSGIVYCLSRKSTEELARRLNEKGFKAGSYHAGMDSADRERVQEEFIRDDLQVICATIAFGMGIDKSNVRWIVHYNLPKNIENYYQEIGRAGRDGLPAATLLFYSYQDVMVLRDIITSNEGQHDVKLAKLERMQQYAESLACRRRILLNYFSEDQGQDCGNCDICRNPPQRFDGTVIAQKALSAVARLGQAAGLTTVIDVLRGSAKKEVFEKGYHEIKTYGAGRDLTINDWQHYIGQLINLGYLYIAHEDHHALRLTPASRRLLFENEKVELVRMATVKERQEAEKERTKAPPTVRERVRDELFEILRQVRKRLAQQYGLPPYMIFSDATLEEMAAARPVTDLDLSRISGVGEQKLKKYGDAFMEAILEYTAQRGHAAKGSTHRITYELFQQGKSIEEIAQQRSLQPTTVYSHLAAVYAGGEPLDIQTFVPAPIIDRVGQCLRYLQQPYRLQDIKEYLNDDTEVHQIRFALVHLEKEGKLPVK